MDELECDSVLYQSDPYFVFDPEDVRNSASFFHLLPTDTLKVTNSDGDLVEITSANLTILLDPIFWSALVLIGFLVLLTCTFCCQCCLACQCSTQRNEKKPLLYKVCCGLFSWLLIGIIIVCVAVTLWSEFTMDAGVLQHWDSLLSFVNKTLPSEISTLSTQQSMQLLLNYQLYRHWISIAVGFVTILIMLTALLSLTLCTPCMESMVPVILMLVLNALWTAVVAVLAAAAFFSLYLTSFVCYDLYRLGGNARCTDVNLREDAISLQLFCSTDVFVPHLVLVWVYFALVIAMITWEIIGAFFASTYSWRDPAKNATRQTNSHLEREGESDNHPLVTAIEELGNQQGPNTNPSQPQEFPMIHSSDSHSATRESTAPRQVSGQHQLQSLSHFSEEHPPQYEDCWTVPAQAAM